MKTEVIAEIGSNWEGSITKANRLIKECKKAGADAVKFQMWRVDDLYKKSNPYYKIMKKSELTFKKAETIKKFADKNGIDFFCVNFLESIDVKRYKIASWTASLKHKNALETVLLKSKSRKPVIISMGMGGNRKYLEKLFSNSKKVVFCYCISEYPLKYEKINWSKAITYDGFSDHTLGIIAPIVFSILKKQQKSKEIFIEKHVKLKTSKGPDSPTSITTEQLSDLMSNIRLIDKSRFPMIA